MVGRLKEFFIVGFTALAFLLLAKLGASYLPDAGVPGALKAVLKGA